MASVASVVSHPALLALGLPPLAANVTNTMSLVFCVPGAVPQVVVALAGLVLAVKLGISAYR
jgi:ABC-type spermidine/putrescine transport system permease subunit II